MQLCKEDGHVLNDKFQRIAYGHYNRNYMANLSSFNGHFYLNQTRYNTQSIYSIILSKQLFLFYFCLLKKMTPAHHLEQF